MFMNCVAIGLPLKAGDIPSGGPLPRVHKIWRNFAKAIDIYGSDIYSPFYKEVSSEFAASNALLIPELGQNKDVASKALYTVAAYNTICFSPFGIDGMMMPLSENDLLAQTNTDVVIFDEYAGDLLAETYRVLHTLWPQICAAQADGHIYAFLQQNDPGTEFVLDDYIIKISYGGGLNHMGQPVPRKEGSPVGGGFVIRESEDTFLICGICCNIKVEPKYASQEQIFVLDKREMKLTDTGFVPGRILNGDERNFLAIGAWPTVQVLKFYRR